MAEIYYGDKIGVSEVTVHADRLGGIVINISNSLPYLIFAVLTIKEARQLVRLIQATVEDVMKIK